MLLFIFILLAGLFLPAVAISAREKPTPCGCYCGIWLPEPCSDAACKQACNYQEPVQVIPEQQPQPDPQKEAVRDLKDTIKKKKQERKPEQEQEKEHKAAVKDLHGTITREKKKAAVSRVKSAMEKEKEFTQRLHDRNSRGLPITAPIQNDKSNRNAYEYSRVINQFHVAQATPRYGKEEHKGGTTTFCNIFVWDVTRAMGAEIPHYIIKNSETGESGVNADGSFKEGVDMAYELTANDMEDWLMRFGKDRGWHRVSSANEAQQMANEGHPSVAVRKNIGSGHIWMVRPGTVGDERGVASAQSGLNVFNAKHLKDVFIKHPDWRREVHFWVHD